MRMDVILRVATKLILPLMLLFAVYIQFHGDYGPGGGFQAGVIAAAAFILYALVYGLEPTKKIVPEALIETMVPLGALIYAGVGIVSFMTGYNYLDYSHFLHDQAHSQEWGVFIVEVGVFVTVSSAMLALFYAFAGRGGS